MQQLHNREISFCIQGPVAKGKSGNNQTEALVQSIDRLFPGSPVILATWKGSDLNWATRLDNVKVLELDDPGSGPRTFRANEPNNINRQLRSSRIALASADTEFAVKVRSDLIFESNRLLKILSKLPGTPAAPLSFFRKYIVVLDRLTIDPDGPLKVPMHPSDYFQAGLLADLRLFWDTSEISLEDESYFLSGRNSETDKSGNHIPRHRAEAYFWKEVVRRHTGQDLSSLETQERDLVISTKSTFIHNLLPMNKMSLGLQSQKYNWGFELSTFTYAFTFFDWIDGTRHLKPKPGMVSFSLFEFLGRIYQVLSQAKQQIFRRKTDKS